MNILVPALALILVAAPVTASANTTEKIDEPTAIVASEDDSISTCAFTQLNITVTSTTDKKIAANLTNTFTLFPSTVSVVVKLYSSLTKTTDLSKMTLEASASSADLNMGETISATASTNGEDKYWVGYAIYFKDNTVNKTYQTEPAFYTADGIYNPAF